MGKFEFRVGLIRLTAALALVVWSSGVAIAQDSTPFQTIDAASCATLDDKNLQVGPPDEEIVAACAEFRRGLVLGQKYSGGPVALGLLLVGLVLTYVVLGVPLRAAAGLMARSNERSTQVLAIGLALALVLRIGVAFLALAALSLPYAMGGASIVMLVATLLSLRNAPALPAPSATEPPPSSLSVLAADAINDVYASAPGILGLAVLAERDPRWLALGLIFALVASIPAVIAARRRARREPNLRTAATAALAALFGAAAFADPNISALAGGGVAAPIASAAVFAVIAAGLGWRLRTARASRRPAGESDNLGAPLA